MKVVGIYYHKRRNKINKYAESFHSNIKQFNQTHQKVLSQSDILNEENKLFSKSFNFYIKERNKKEQYTQKIFKNLILEYVDKGYEVPDLNFNPKLFSNHPLTSKREEDIQAFYYTKKRPITFDKSNNYICKLLDVSKKMKFHQLSPPKRKDTHFFNIKNIGLFKKFKQLILKNFTEENKKLREYNESMKRMVSIEDETSNKYANNPKYSMQNNNDSDISLINKKILIKAKRYESSNNLRGYRELNKPSFVLPKKSKVDVLALTNSTNLNDMSNSNSTNKKKKNYISKNKHKTESTFIKKKGLKTANIFTVKNEAQEMKKKLYTQSIKRLKEDIIPLESSTKPQVIRNSMHLRSFSNTEYRSSFLLKNFVNYKKKKISRNEKSNKLEELFAKSFNSESKSDCSALVKEYKDYLLNYKQMIQTEIDNLTPKDFSFAKEFFYFSKTLKTKLQDASLLERCKGIFSIKNPLHRAYLKKLKHQEKEIYSFNLDYLNSLYSQGQFKKKEKKL